LLPRRAVLRSLPLPRALHPLRRLRALGVGWLRPDALARALRKQLGSSKALPKSPPLTERAADALAGDLAAALAETPAAFANRIAVYWTAWRSASN
ncbi:MAG: hypothetical protein ACPGYV_13950, partial [Phycisphaeraceae bacterium]